MNRRTRAILWAQWRMLVNRFPRARVSGVAFGVVASVIWYGMWIGLAVLLGGIFRGADAGSIRTMLGGGLLFIFLYWQIVPVLMAASGASLDIRKLRAYPVPHVELFSIELLLRVTTAMEMALCLAGIAIGLEFNHAVPKWAPPLLALFGIFNLGIAAGIREILVRLFARKRVREVAIFLLVLCGALPQMFMINGGRIRLSALSRVAAGWGSPWSAAASLVLGESILPSLLALLGWTIAACLFGRYQFERGLRFDADEAGASQEPVQGSAAVPAWRDRLFRWPARLFPDPLAAMIEKEIRFLSRAPRFRLVFTMGFTFGLIIWLPIVLKGNANGVLGRNYLTLVCGYALLLLGDVCFWNTFGFDRRAAQIYFVTPVRFSTVLAAKNISTLYFVLLEITAITTVCAILRMPVTLARLGETYAVTLVTCVFLASIGNLTSTYNPRGVSPDRSMRSGATGMVQAMLVLVYPVAGIPVALAYGARYALDSEWAFYAALLIDAAVGAIFYWVAMDSAVGRATRERESVLERLSQSAGVIQA